MLVKCEKCPSTPQEGGQLRSGSSAVNLQFDELRRRLPVQAAHVGACRLHTAGLSHACRSGTGLLWWPVPARRLHDWLPAFEPRRRERRFPRPDAAAPEDKLGADRLLEGPGFRDEDVGLLKCTRFFLELPHCTYRSSFISWQCLKAQPAP